jgi:hypothetical protein
VGWRNHGETCAAVPRCCPSGCADVDPHCSGLSRHREHGVGATPSHFIRILAPGTLRAARQDVIAFAAAHTEESCARGELCSPCRFAKAANGRRRLAVGLYEVPREDVASGIAASVGSETQERQR